MSDDDYQSINRTHRHLNQYKPVKTTYLGGSRMEAKIEGIKLTCNHKYDPVTFVPKHAEGNAGDSDCNPGVLISWDDFGAKVLYCDTRTIQLTYFKDLVWG